MARNAYYKTPHWRALKQATHKRDGWRCTVPGCTSTDRMVCDHIETRPNVDYPTSLDVLSNTRTLCDRHDRQIKEGRDGQRMRGGSARVVGSDADGWPLNATTGGT
jgi:hypothetical protein